MVSVLQYPYNLEVLNNSGETKDPETGDFLAPTDNWVFVSKCRDEAGSGRKITLADNSIYEYSYLIQIPKGIDAIEIGKTVRVKAGEEVRAHGTVKYSRKDQLHTRAWL